MFRKLLVSAAIAVLALTGAATAQDKVKFGTLRVPTQVFVGIEKGYFAEQGIEVEPVFYKSGSEIGSAVATDQVDAALTTTGAALLNAMARDLDMVLVAAALTLDPDSPGGDPTAIVIRKEVAEEKGNDLSGLKLGVTAPGQILDIILRTYLKENKVAPDDVKIVSMPLPDMPAALSSKALDGGVLIDPFLAKVLAAGEVNVVAKASEVLPGATQGFIVYSKKMVENHDLGVRFMRAFLQANSWLREAAGTDEGRAEIATIYQKHFPLKDQNTYKTIALVMASEDGVINVDGEYGMNWMLAQLKEQGLVPTEPNISDFVDNSFVTEASAQ